MRSEGSFDVTCRCFPWPLPRSKALVRGRKLSKGILLRPQTENHYTLQQNATEKGTFTLLFTEISMAVKQSENLQPSTTDVFNNAKERSKFQDEAYVQKKGKVRFEEAALS